MWLQRCILRSRPMVRWIRTLAATAEPSSIVTPVLREYQRECIRACLSELAQGYRRQIVSLPVGSGKTVVMANLLSSVPDPNPVTTAKKTLIIAHRTELLEQARRQILRFYPHLRVVIDQGTRKPDISSADVVVASVQTLGRTGSCRLERYDPLQFKTIMIDEVHHAAANTYVKILEHFGTLSPDSHIYVWGCSATVRRHDGIGLSPYFDKIVYHMDLLQMIEAGWLCPVRVTTVHTKVDLSKVATRYDDFQQAQLSRAVNIPLRNKIVFESWKKFAPGRKSTLVFAVDMEHTLTLCNVFRERGVDAEFVTSKTPAAERRDILNRFYNGAFPVLVNCGILTEGTDIPGIDCILMARPTRSSVLFQQMFGRGMRLSPTKKDCIVIDFVDNFAKSGKEGLVTFPTLMGLDPSELVRDENVLDMEKRVIEKQEEKKQEPSPYSAEDPIVRINVTEYEDFEEFMMETNESPALQNVSQYNWVTVGDRICALHVITLGTLVLRRDDDGTWRATLQHDPVTIEEQKIFIRPRKLALEADTWSSAIRAADTWVRQQLSQQRKGSRILAQLKRNAPFRKHPATEAQLRILQNRFKITPRNGLTKGQAMDMITRLTLGQGKLWRDAVKQQIEREKAEQAGEQRAVLKRTVMA